MGVSADCLMPLYLTSVPAVLFTSHYNIGAFVYISRRTCIFCDGRKIMVASLWYNHLHQQIISLKWSLGNTSHPSWINHWGPVTYIRVAKGAIIGSDNGLSPDRRQAIIWTNAGTLLIQTIGTTFSEIFIRNSFIFTEPNAFENVVCELAAI